MIEYFAHSENNRNQKHGLSEHLHQTAKLTESFACQEKYKPIFKMTGFLHDLGKYQPAFQNYLKNGGRRGSVPHASWGAGYAGKLKMNEASIAIDGHHKGMPDKAAWKSDINPYIHNDVREFSDIVHNFHVDAGTADAEMESLEAISFSNGFQREFFIRYLFSSLTDADWLSTEEHFDPEKSAMRTEHELPIDLMICELDKEISCKSKEGEINQLRSKTREQALSRASLPVGFYSLTLPTGMGKTLTSFSWALHHAKHNELKRIIIVLPYTNIIDQTAQELKKIFGEALVLEHHSSYNEGEKDGEDKNEDLSPDQKRHRLACENWDYPVIVTTTVQFFESLFSNKPSKCRKIHNIAQSVVIFDEVQTLPKDMIAPTLQMLTDIQVVMGSSFLFCTATQPAFEKRPKFDGINSIQPLVTGPGMLYEKTRRVEYHLLGNLTPVDYGRLSDVVVENDHSTLVIFNTKKAALEFHNTMKALGNWEHRYHLSTSMCPAHRKETIEKIRSDLKENKNILVVSTQLIEAGVDFDFPVLFRAMAPMEAVIQAAGRCNRDGKLSGYGKVFLFNLQDGGMPDKTYAACAGFAEELIMTEIEKLYSYDTFEKYYADVVNLYVDTDKYGINNARKEFNFETVKDIYHLIKDGSEGIFIYNYSEESRQLLDSLRNKKFLSRNDYRNMQTFTVQVYENFLINNIDYVETLQQGYKIWYGNYDSATGVSVAPIEADNYVV